MADKPAAASNPGGEPESFRITKVYTRAGDGGSTRLVGGQSIPKNHPRLNAYGTVDELQVAMGAALDALAPFASASPLLFSLRQHMLYWQNRLFTLGGDLATRLEDRWPGMPLIAAEDAEAMEELIDALNDPLPPLKDFVLPGGHAIVTALHQCRVVCRRAEREVETLAQAEPINPAARTFLNRLSDLFFVMARAAAQELRARGLLPGSAGSGEETIWRRDLPFPPLPE